MTQIIGISVVALIFGLFMRDYNKTVSLILVIFAALLILFKTIGGITEIAAALNDIASGVSETSAYIKLMFKVLGIALVTQIVADLCRDCGESALASQTEVAAKIIIVTLILPLFETVVKIISGLLV